MRHWTILIAPTALLAACGEPEPADPAAPAPEPRAAETEPEPVPAPSPETLPETPGVETIGVIEAGLGDGQRTWFITADSVRGDLISQSNYSADAVGTYAINLFGHASEDTVFSTQEALTVSFNVEADTTTLRREVVFIAGSLSESYRAEEDAVSIELYTLEEEGGLISISGRFDATLTWQGDEGEAPMGETIEIGGGTFEAALAPAN